MANKYVTVLDVGSSKISLLVGTRGVNDSISVKCETERSYGGFFEGQFFDENDLYTAVKSAVLEIEEKLDLPIGEVFVGVPGAFVKLVNKKYKISFLRAKRIRRKDIDCLFDGGQANIVENGYEVIGRSPLYFVLDDSRRVDDPEGTVSSMLGGCLTYFLCENYFVNLLGKILEELKIKTVNFVYTGQAEGDYLLSDEERDYPSLILDVGYTTSDVSIHYGKGVLAKFSEDFGGGMLAFTLMTEFELTPDESEELKRSINFGYSSSSSLTYTVSTNDGEREISCEEVNEKAVECVDTFVGQVYEFLEENSKKIPDNPRVYLTGGGISFLRGVKLHLSARFGVSVEILAPSVPFFNKANKSSVFAVLDYALKKQESKKSFFKF